MTEVIVTSHVAEIQRNYQIIKDGITIFITQNALTPFNDVLYAFGLNNDNVVIRDSKSGGVGTPLNAEFDRDTYDFSAVQMYRDAIFDDSIEKFKNISVSPVDVDNIINDMNNTMPFRNIERYIEILAPEKKSEDIEIDSIVSTSAPTQQKTPVGSVKTPVIGDLIYIDGIKSVLNTILGGVVTVSAVHVDTKTLLGNDTSVEDNYDDDYDDDDDDDYTEGEPNILVELEEFPGFYVSWSMLRSKQEELADKYGYKPAQKI